MRVPVKLGIHPLPKRWGTSAPYLIKTDFIYCDTDELENGVYSLVGHLCDFCRKDAIERCHCSGVDSCKCSERFKNILKNEVTAND